MDRFANFLRTDRDGFVLNQHVAVRAVHRPRVISRTKILVSTKLSSIVARIISSERDVPRSTKRFIRISSCSTYVTIQLTITDTITTDRSFRRSSDRSIFYIFFFFSPMKTSRMAARGNFSGTARYDFRG